MTDDELTGRELEIPAEAISSFVGCGVLAADVLAILSAEPDDLGLGMVFNAPDCGLLIDRRSRDEHAQSRIQVAGEIGVIARVSGDDLGAFAFRSDELLLRLADHVDLRTDGSNPVQEIQATMLRIDGEHVPGLDPVADDLATARQEAVDRVTLFVEPGGGRAGGAATCLQWVRTARSEVWVVPAAAAGPDDDRPCARVPETYLWGLVVEALGAAGLDEIEHSIIGSD